MKFRINLKKYKWLVVPFLGQLVTSLCYPVNSFLIRVWLIVNVLITILAVGIIVSKKRHLAKPVIGGVLLSVIIIFSSKLFGTKNLEEYYLISLKSYEGTRYHWGGENSLGIDCSGLPRKALINAFYSRGKYLKGLEMWWFDCSAKAMSEGYRDYTVKIASFKSLRKVDYSRIKPGDLAVTASGVHVIVYLGEEKWIQADPEQGRVVIEEPTTTASSWFDTPVNIVRWQSIN